MSANKAAIAQAAVAAIRYNVPVDGFGQSKRLDEYAAIWGNAVAQKLVTDRLVANVPADIDSTWELTEEERIALPAEYHQPVWMDLTTPKSWICSQCWGDGWQSEWPCKVAAENGKAVAVAGGMKVAQ